MLKIDKQIEEMIEDTKERERIRCPYCNHVQSQEVVCAHISYYGSVDKCEDEIEECEECGQRFIVVEWVEREFQTRKIEGEQGCRQKGE